MSTTKTKTLFRYPPAVFFVLSLTIGLLLVFRSSQAEFEVPVVDTSNFIASDARGIFGFYRSQWDGQAGHAPQEYYEAWAAGKYFNSDAGSDAAVLYRWAFNTTEDKYQWEPVLPVIGGYQPPFTAIGGQFDHGSGYPEMWLAYFDEISSPKKIAKIIGTNGNGAETDVPDIAAGLNDLNNPTAQSQLVQSSGNAYGECQGNQCRAATSPLISMYQGRQCLTAAVNSPDCPTTAPPEKPFYAIGGAQTFGGYMIAGGQDRQLYMHASAAAGGCPVGGCQICDNINPSTEQGNCRINTSQVCTNSNKNTVCLMNPIPDSWRDISGTLLTVSGFNPTDDITGIAYVNDNTAYVSTTSYKASPTFSTTVHPYDRSCAVNDDADGVGLPTGKVFRVVGDPSSAGNWKQVAQLSDACFFGVAAGTIDTPAALPANGPLRNYVWLAVGSSIPGNNGVFRFLDSDFRTTASVLTPARVYTPPASCSGLTCKIFSVSAARNLGGDRPSSGGVPSNLLMNGEFNAQINPTAAADDINPDHWQIVGQNALEQRMPGPSCNAANAAKDVTIIADSTADASTAPGATPNDRAVVIEPGQNVSSCNSGPATLVFNTTNDAEIRSTANTTNYGANATLPIDSDGAIQDSVLKFDVSGLAGRTVTGVTLSLYVNNGSGGLQAGTVSAAGNNYLNTTTPWVEGSGTGQIVPGVTWSNAPPVTSPAPWTPVNLGILGNGVSITVTLPVAAVTGDGTYSFRLRPGSTDQVIFASKENGNAARIPKLNVTVSGIPLIDSATNAVGATYVSNRVPLTGVEGKKYRVTGKYKVEFLNTTTTPAIPTATPPNAFGGVQIACTGAKPPTGNVECSMSSNAYLRNQTTGPTSGFENINLIVSRQDTQLIAPVKGVQSTPKITGQGLALEIRCIGTYGTRVTCDDLHVEEVNDPAVPPHDLYLVAAVGQSGLAVSSQNGAATTPVFKDEKKVGVNEDITAVTAVDPTHVYAAGLSGTVLQRSVGNITGYIWAGTASAGNQSVNSQTAAGWISTNCANVIVGGKSLCQKNSSAYGVSLENNAFSGRAWFGKNVSATFSDQETINLGQCIGGIPGSSPYDLTGACELTGAAPNRRCAANPGRVCFNDFDCYGHCQRDSAFMCVTDGDCQVGGTAVSGATVPGPFATYPYFRVQCSAGNRSPLACTSNGWLTFNPSEFSNVIYNPPTAGPPASINTCTGGGACLDPATNSIHGVAQFMTIGNPSEPNNVISPATIEKSWVSFRGPVQTSPPFPASTELYACKGCTGVGPVSCKFCQDGNNRSCTPAVNAPTAQYPYSCQLYCDGARNRCSGGVNDTKACIVPSDCPGGTCTAPGTPCTNDAQSQCSGIETCRPAGYCSLKNGASLVACATDADCSGFGSCNLGADCNPAGATCRQYGVNFDDVSGKLSGYAWSPAYGWLQFSDLRRGTASFLQTKLGDIYATGRIGARDINSCPTRANATYLVSTPSGSIVNFCSSLSNNSEAVSSGVNIVDANAPQISFASPDNIFSNVLGRFDLSGMTSVARTDAGGLKNKYGSEIVDLPVDNATGQIKEVGRFDPAPGSINLQGAVYRVGSPGGTNTYILAPSQPASFKSNCGTASGAGLLVVYGNLEIHNNLSYKNCTGSLDLRGIASLVVYVSGDLIIKNEVTNLVGAYYVGDTIHTSSAINDGTNRYPLTVRGLMIAKRFVFGRSFAGTVDNPLPSELIIYDGRLQSNPLPGMTDFASALPNTLNTGP